MKKNISLILIFLISILAFAQKQGPVISWEKTTVITNEKSLVASVLEIKGIVITK
jgi:hypothetical protein